MVVLRQWIGPYMIRHDLASSGITAYPVRAVDHVLVMCRTCASGLRKPGLASMIGHAKGACAGLCSMLSHFPPECVAGGPKCMSAIKRQIMHSRTRTGRATLFGQRRTKPLVRQAACISSLVILALLVFCSLRTLPPDFMEVTFELQRVARTMYR